MQVMDVSDERGEGGRLNYSRPSGTGSAFKARVSIGSGRHG